MRGPNQLRLILFLSLLPCSLVLKAQLAESSLDSTHQKQTYITARYNYGFTIPHHISMMYLLEDYVQGVEVNYGVANFDKNHWGKYFNYPELGIGFLYSSLGNSDVYGNGYALFPYANFHICRSKKFNASYKVALGVGYADRPFNLDENPQNDIFGSKINVYVGFGLLLDYKVMKHLSLTGTLSLNHLSNGALQKPNHGVNLLSVSGGIKYHLLEDDYPEVLKVKAPRSNKKEFIGVLSLGRSHSSSYYPKKHWSASINLNYLWHRSLKRAWGIGADIIYYGDAPYYFRGGDRDIDKDFKTTDFMYGGLLGSYNVFLNRLTMVMQLGVYVLYETNPDQPVYSRVGLRYNISDRLLANFTVKAGFFKSEFLEFGLGYRIQH